MLERVSLPGITLPTLYIAKNAKDVQIAQDAGIPYVRWSHGKDALLRCLLRPTLEKMFPYIKWNKVFGEKRRFASEIAVVPGLEETASEEEEHRREKFIAETGCDPDAPLPGIESPRTYDSDEDGTLTEYADIADEERVFSNKGHEGFTEKLDLETYMGDLSSCVNLEVLQSLKLMPKFIGDIVDCIQNNYAAQGQWSEGYTKKLGACLGNYNRSGELPNLMILDISGSIPRGISATMIQLIDTLRTETHSDLIITAGKSEFYPHGSELPSPRDLRDQFDYGNESQMFGSILRRYVINKHWGHVISFGDNDAPNYKQLFNVGLNLGSTEVNELHAYHTGEAYSYTQTGFLDDCTGYSKWCTMLARKPKITYDTSWCTVINK